MKSSEFSKQLRKSIADKLGVEFTNWMQVVGDSDYFTLRGSHFVRETIVPMFDHASLLEYGYTGHSREDGTLDVNGAVNIWVDGDTSAKRASKVLANIVGHTYVALEKWKATASSNVENFVVVYNDSPIVDDDGVIIEPEYDPKTGYQISGFTTFGSDIAVSDFLLDGELGDKMLCLEGGAQSFAQIVNVLSRNVPVTIVTNLRTDDGESANFSAAEILKRIYKLGEDVSEDVVRVVFDTYVASKKELFNMRRPDFDILPFLPARR
jgi:hypothetical protein